MENKIKIKVEEEVLRLSIPTENGMIVINEPSKKFKSDLVNSMVTLLADGKDVDDKQVMLDLINHCTNVEFDGDIFESTNLSHEAQMIVNEIISIFQDIVAEACQLVKLAMQQAKNEALQNEIIKEKDVIEEIIEERKVKEEVKEIKEKRNVKKPSRSRGKMSRR